MAVVKLNVSLEEQVAAMLRKRSAELKKPASRYLADLILEDAQRSRDELAEEGYRLLSADTRSFADAALPLSLEVWPEWQPENVDETPKPKPSK
jgi:hypothetical protein